MKLTKKEKALALRKRGRSLGEIARALEISKSTASLWTKHVVIGEAGLKRIKNLMTLNQNKGHQILHEKKLERLKAAEDEASILLNKIKINRDNELVALAMMYWCEGKKNDNGIGFTNSDPNLVKTFITMMESVFMIDKNKWRVCVHLHDYHKEVETLKFWSTITNIPLSQFNKSFKKKSNHKYIQNDYKGCVRINYGDAHLSRVLLSFAKNFIKLYI